MVATAAAAMPQSQVYRHKRGAGELSFAAWLVLKEAEPRRKPLQFIGAIEIKENRNQMRSALVASTRGVLVKIQDLRAGAQDASLNGQPPRKGGSSRAASQELSLQPPQF